MPLSASFSELDPRTTTPVSDLSRYGVFVQAQQLHPIGTIIDLRFVVFPDDPILFQAIGRVVRHGADPSGMGVEFEQLDDANVQIVEEILRRYDTERTKRTTRRKRFARDRQTGLRAHGLVAKVVDPDERK